DQPGGRPARHDGRHHIVIRYTMPSLVTVASHSNHRSSSHSMSPSTSRPSSAANRYQLSSDPTAYVGGIAALGELVGTSPRPARPSSAAAGGGGGGGGGIAAAASGDGVGPASSGGSVEGPWIVGGGAAAMVAKVGVAGAAVDGVDASRLVAFE